jgi:glycerol-3-phosphate acyltransferase PlsX
MIRVALDAMGGDHAPSEIVAGAVQAARKEENKFQIILCGPEKQIEQELAKNGWEGDKISIVDAPELVAMDESPSAVLKTKPNSGLVSCVALQKKGLADASVSAGNSGAMMAACLMLLGRIGRIGRPALATLMPAVNRKYIMLDVGANVDEKPQMLVDFAVCGSIYAESLGYKNPTVGLLNVGEEDKKGPEVLQETNRLLRESSLNFYGNVEGHDLMKGTVDVVVAPGYVGNVTIKLVEGFFALHNKLFGKICETEGQKAFYELWDYRNHGGAPLLGLNGTGIITHGRADAQAICRSLEIASLFAEGEVSQKIADRIKS